MSVLVLLDLHATFDSTDHDMLLLRMEKLSGLKGSALNCFQSYPLDPLLLLFVHVNN